MLNETIRQQFEKEYQIALGIKSYIHQDFHFDIVDDEVTFLTIHINRLLTDA
ncbi:PRD domain-containing protein [Jeotgalibaca arthritidis]